METLQDLIKARREKLARWEEAGHEAWPYSFERSHTIANVLEHFEEYETKNVEVSLAGRLVAKRVMGKAAFAHLHDDTERVQIYVKRDEVNPEGAEGAGTPYSLFKTATDLGDWIGVTGTLMVTKTGERTIQVSAITLLAKSLRPLPVVKEDAETGRRYHEFSDPDERYRNRALDLIVNPEEREVFRTRAAVIRTVRDELDRRSFLEVETPVLQPLYGGGTARPFITHHNQLKKDLYLRIADELYLKRLIVGGLPRVYEIGKDFRNEGVDRTHNPEFTMMECYAAFQDYSYMMELLESLVARLVEQVHGGTTLTFDGTTIDVTPPWPRVRFFDALQQATGRDLRGSSLEEVKAFADEAGIEYPEKATWAKVVDEIMGELVEPGFNERATFVVDYPLELSPLAKRHRSEERLVERFEAFMGGFEIANAFSELNDPLDQRRRFEEQQSARTGGDEEAMPLDEDFLEVLELGMPPTAGLGVGIDRLVMLLTDRTTIRDVILFPLLRDRMQAGEADEGEEPPEQG